MSGRAFFDPLPCERESLTAFQPILSAHITWVSTHSRGRARRLRHFWADVWDGADTSERCPALRVYGSKYSKSNHR